MFTITAIIILIKLQISLQIDCNYFNTINITNGRQNSDESITYNNIKYLKGTYQKYNYIYVNQTIRLNVDEHIRGCVCDYKFCINVCCDYGESINIRELNGNLSELKFQCQFSDDLNQNELKIAVEENHIHDIYDSRLYEARFNFIPICSRYTSGLYDLKQNEKIILKKVKNII